MELQVCSVVVNSKVTDAKLLTQQQYTERDHELHSLCRFIRVGWPEKLQKVPPELKHYAYGLVLKGKAIVVPNGLRQEILRSIHAAHQGQEKCLQRARGTVFFGPEWHLISHLLLKIVRCARNLKNLSIGVDKFFLHDKPYLLVVDYYSKWVELQKLKSQTSPCIISHMKSTLVQLGIPAVVMSDGGSNLTSLQFDKFAQEWNFIHQTSSPRYPQSSGMSECHVQTVKKTLKVIQDEKDVNIALLELRNTPIIQGHSPAQLLMGRRLRGCIPIVPAVLNPSLPNHKEVRAALLAKQT
ncbi:hypothetical protein PR048_001612 [Dryococelus australis]|uniref:Integrase catalytic domain-containing protein n=1 Tax=Dryococelus australis TaxID=614101 RepID=A0ABQ9IHV6_9NEOP|nr:hypothetical protein PR048_001612 [Dryococelus australis]